MPCWAVANGRATAVLQQATVVGVASCVHDLPGKRTALRPVLPRKETLRVPLGLGYTRVLGHQYLYIRVFIRIRVYMD